MQPVDHTPTPHRITRINLFGPAQNIFIGRHIQKFRCIILAAQNQLTVPWPNGDVGNRVFIANHIL